MDKAYILKEIQRTTKENNDVPLGMNKFSKETGIKKYDWLGRYWSKWSDAVIEAGYKPNRMQSAYDSNWLIEQIIFFIREIKKFPSPSEFRLKGNNVHGFPSHNTIRSRLGNQDELARNIINYCKEHQEYSDVIDVCSKYLNSAFNIDKGHQTSEGKNEDRSLKPDENNFGYVYLMKSGRFYKIGNSNNVERRSYDLGIKLPERIQISHKIRTDDPTGIEKYWHDKFVDKRKQGEWFDLSGEDVAAFKRRKFM